ncbi:MAG: ParB/RepB/Spo0J family partition protein [Chloroflexi bacterium]|nr:ParB/RepB/Spo0J family partition protein [Chloroflexota bacterium]
MKRGLGKGLAALIPPTSPSIEMVEVDVIVPNPYQPRFAMDRVALEELAASIREHGVLQPLVVTRLETAPDGRSIYQLIAGERRWQAAKLAELERVPVVVKEANPQETLEIALVENLQRADLSPLEEARAYRQLIAEFALTQEGVAQRVGKSRAAVANSVRLLGLSQEIQESLGKAEITEGHARSLLAVRDESLRRRLWQRVVQFGLNVRQTEQAARRLEAGIQRIVEARRISDPETRVVEDRLRTALGTRVSLIRGRKGGKLVIHFYSDEELETLLQIMIP